MPTPAQCGRERPRGDVSERPRVLVRERIAEAGVELLRDRFDVDVDLDGALEERIGAYDGLIVRSATKVTAEPARAGRAASRDRPGGRRGRQRGRRRGDETRHSRRQRAGVHRRLGGRARHRAPSGAGTLDPAGARRAEGRTVGALPLRGNRAGREDARRRRLRPYRPAGSPAGPRPGDARRRLRPVRRARAHARGGRGARCLARGAARGVGLRDPAHRAHGRVAKPDRALASSSSRRTESASSTRHGASSWTRRR